MTSLEPQVGAGHVGLGGVGQTMPDPTVDPTTDPTTTTDAPPTWGTAVASMTQSTDDLARRLKLIRQFAPTLAEQRVDLANQLASSNLSDDDLIQQTNAVMGSAVTQQEGQAISHLDAQARQDAWARMTPDRQQAFRSLGFNFDTAPQQAGGDGGFFGSVLHGVASAAAGVGHVVTDDLGGALHAIGAPLRSVQHTARWMKYIDENGTFDGAWSRTANGERWFANQAVSDASELVGGDPSKLLIAQRLAGGDSVEDLVKASGAAPGSPEYSATYKAVVDLVGDDNMQSAVQTLDRGKYSFGRVMAHTFGIDPASNPGLYNTVSGSVDALFDLTLDPLIVGGKVTKGYRAAKYGVDLLDGAPTLAKFGLQGSDLDKLDAVAGATKADRLDALSSGRSGEYFRRLAQLDVNPVQRYTTMVADHFAIDGNPMISQLVQADPRISKVVTDLSNWNLLLKNENGLADVAQELSNAGTGISDPSDVARFLNDSNGTADIMRGRWGSYLHRGVEMPHMTRLQSARAATKIGWTSTINFLADELPDFSPDIFDTKLGGGMSNKALDVGARQFSSGVATLGLEDPGVLAKTQAAGAEAIQRLLHAPARVLQGLTTLQPTRDVLQLAGEHTFEGLDRFLAFGMGGDERAALVNQFFDSAPGARLKLLRGAIVTMGERAGIADTAAGREFLDNVARGGLQQYAPNGADLMETPFGPSSQGIMPKADMAFGAGLPGFKEWQGMAGQARRLSLTHALFGSVPAQWGDAFLGGYWKPSVLLRIGFIPRVAGEEALGAVARLGANFLPGNWLGAIGGNPDEVNLSPLRAMHDSLTSGIPDSPSDFEDAGRLIAGRKAASMSSSELAQLGQDSVSNAQRGRLMLGRFVEATGRRVTPIVRATARGGQAAVTALGQLGEANLAEGVGRALSGGDLRQEVEVGSRIAQAREASAATQLGKAVNRAGERLVPGEGRVIDLPRSEIEERLRMANRFSRDPRIQDAYARALAGGVGTISSNRLNLVTTGDDPRITVLDRGPRGSEPTELRLRPVGSEYETYHSTPQADSDYGLHSVLFDHVQSWQIGRMADEPTMTAAAHAVNAYVSPGQAVELQRAMGVPDGYAYARSFRESYASLPKDLQQAMRDIVNDTRTNEDPVELIEKAKDITADQRQFAMDLYLHADVLKPGTLNMLTVDLAKSHQAIVGGDLERAAAALTDTSATSAREAIVGDEGASIDTNAAAGRELAAPPVGAHFAQNQAETERARQLVDRMGQGDRRAVDEAARQATRRALLAPEMAPYRDASLRNIQTSDGRALQQPVAAQHARLYGILADVPAFEALSQADRATALAGITDKRLVPIVNALIDEGARMPMSPAQLADLRSTTGRSVLAPMTSVVMEDPQLANQLANAVGEAMVAAQVPPGIIPPSVGEMDIHRHLLDEHTTEVNKDLGIYQGGAGILAKLAPARDSVTHEQLIDDWVDKLLQLQEHRMRSAVDGRVLHEITRPVADHEWSQELLGNLDRRELPTTEIGPKYETAHEGVWSKITNWGFNKVLGPGIDAMIRTPLFAEHYMQATRDLGEMEKVFVDSKLDAQARELLAKKGLGVDATREAMRDLNMDGLNVRDGEWPSSETVRRHLPPHMAGLSDDEILRVSRWASRSAQEDFVPAGEAGKVWDDTVGDWVSTARRKGPMNDSTAEWMTTKRISPRDTYKLFTQDMPPSVWQPHLADDFVDVNRIRQQLPDALAGMTDGQIHMLRSWHSNLESAEQLSHQVAIDRATNEIIPYIHDHHVRSQFQEWGRHFMPFEFAEEQFLKRWARTLTHSPEALEKGMLTLNGLRHSGIIQKDEYGNDVFIYPGSAAVTRTLGQAIESFTGTPYTLPIGVPLTGAVKYTVPGLDHEGLPGVSPLVAIGLGGLRRRFPEFSSAENALEGDRGAAHSFWDQLIPPPAMKLYRFYHDDPERDAKLGSASMSVMAMMAAKDGDHFRQTGEHLYPGLDPAATDDDIEKFISRVSNYTRTMMLARGLMGFGVPASPAPLYQGDLHPQLIKLMAAFPNDPGQAFAEFIHQYPDAQPYEIFGTKSKSGAPLPSTEAVGNFLDQNQAFVDRYKSAGAWFLPQAQASDAPSRQVYNRLVADGLRIHKGPREWMDNYYFSSAAPTYFDSRDLHDQAMTHFKNNPAAREKERSSWSQWETQYFKQNPTFARVLQSSDRKEQRGKTLTEMRLALNDPSQPDTPHAQAIGDIVRGYDDYQQALVRLGARRDTMSMQRRHTIQTNFARWVTNYSQAHPDVRSFYQQIVKPDLSIPNLSEIEAA